MPVSAFADYLLMSNVHKGCSSDLDSLSYLRATFAPTEYRCMSGEYLPANTDHCEKCPDLYNCNGGTYSFNEYKNQGVDSIKTHINKDVIGGCKIFFVKPNKNIANITATFSPNVHTCVAGQFLPANVDGCSPCLPDNYCAGGTFTFSETVDQGLSPCPDAHPFAPAGMWTQSQCGRKLHVGDDVLYLHQGPATPTARRLYVRFNDVVYSANATEVSIAPTTMSEYAKRALHVIIDGVEYLIHDDSAK